jgi:glycosyltransferase involved in cell wall biosynthesis
MNTEVTLGIIALNEELYIDQCLKYHKPFFDHIVLLDGGSFDSTVSIAEFYELEIYSESKVDVPSNDFAAMRNFIADKSGTEWVLGIDCDELLDYNFLTNMLEYVAPSSPLRREHVVAFRFPRINLDNGHPIDYHVRLYKPAVCEWREHVHEKLFLKGTDVQVDQAHVENMDVCQTLEGHNIIHLQRSKRRRLEQRDRWDQLATE